MQLNTTAPLTRALKKKRWIITSQHTVSTKSEHYKHHKHRIYCIYYTLTPNKPATQFICDCVASGSTQLPQPCAWSCPLLLPRPPCVTFKTVVSAVSVLQEAGTCALIHLSLHQLQMMLNRPSMSIKYWHLAGAQEEAARWDKRAFFIHSPLCGKSTLGCLPVHFPFSMHAHLVPFKSMQILSTMGTSQQI